MAVRLVYAVGINKKLPIVDFAGKIVSPKTNMTESEILFVALNVIDKVEEFDGIFLENPSTPLIEGDHFYFSAGFRSYEDLHSFLISVKNG